MINFLIKYSVIHFETFSLITFIVMVMKTVKRYLRKLKAEHRTTMNFGRMVSFKKRKKPKIVLVCVYLNCLFKLSKYAYEISPLV